MQVFVPYSDFSKCAEVLDDKRLCKQALESTQLLDIMYDLPTKTGKPRTGWLNHPALIAWEDTPVALIQYTLRIVAEMHKRGFKSDTYFQKLIFSYIKDVDDIPSEYKMPVWWGDERIHSSHRVRLLQKGWEEKFKYGDKANKTIEWYSQFEWIEMTSRDFFRREYKWPVNITTTSYQLEERVSKAAIKVKDELINAYGMNPYGENPYGTN